MSDPECTSGSKKCGFMKAFGNGDAEKNAIEFKYSMEQIPGEVKDTNDKIDSVNKRVARIEIYFWILMAVSAKETLLPLLKLIS